MRARGAGRPGVLTACAAVVLAAAGCTSSPHRELVSSVARTFVTDLERGDGSGACQLLTADAQHSASGATDLPCAKAITSITEHGSAVHGVQVWGDAAQVRLGDDVVFLRRVSGAWRVSAAGCTSRPEGPYDCTVGS